MPKKSQICIGSQWCWQMPGIRRDCFDKRLWWQSQRCNNSMFSVDSVSFIFKLLSREFSIKNGKIFLKEDSEEGTILNSYCSSEDSLCPDDDWYWNFYSHQLHNHFLWGVFVVQVLLDDRVITLPKLKLFCRKEPQSEFLAVSEYHPPITHTWT